jgi:LuxR family maltose regulon positive regulatory protein
VPENADSGSPKSRPASQSAATAAIEGADHRVTAPDPREGIVGRTALVDALLASRASVVAIVAPPGYGKTTLMAQWAQRLAPRVAWVSCDDSDNDPATLWTAIIAALHRLAPVNGAASDLLARAGGDLAVVPELVSALAEVDSPVVVMLDHVEAIRNQECWAALAEFAFRLPRGWRLAFGSRDAVPIPISRLRIQGRMLEIGVEELAMTPSEARHLVAGAAVEVTDSEADALVRQTEGWPAGLYLAALALKAGTSAKGFTFTGDDRLMRDYLRSELLARVSIADREFLTQTSILDRMSGPLCDAVLGGAGSARTLEELEVRNLLVVPLDRRGQWYRYHHLLRDLLHSELLTRDLTQVRDLHGRASAWFAANGMAEQAIGHAQAAGDAEQVARLVLDVMQPLWAGGRVETVRSWMEWLSEHPPAEFYPAIAAHGSLISALLGRAAEAERWAAAAESVPATGVLPDGSTEEATLAYLRAILARDGSAAARRDAADALAGLSPISPYRASMVHTIGLSLLLEDDLDGADAAFAEAHDLGADTLPVAALALAERHLVAVARGDSVAADGFIERAVESVDAGRLGGFWTSALVFAAAAHASARRGRMAEARQYVKLAARLRPLLTHMLPVVSVQALLELTHAYLELVDPEGARAGLQQAFAILVRRPALGNLSAAADDLRTRLGQIVETTPAGASSLTAAELRLLPLLPTHLSFPQIAERLYLSRHTVKTQVASVYRKLGVSSRREAVDKMTELRIAG